ncbi:MAG: Rne/Rng family ribonuclease [SAR324 cluster bacterium]|nr:Rne/Rng family ribonuclease [SAR324 cluster bacterium]
MAKQIMLVNIHEGETRIAISENNLLVGLHMQQTDRERRVGNIYRGTIVKINPAFQAAFVDYGVPKNGFLSISDVNFDLFKPRGGEKGRPKIQSVLREGQQVMVQVLKEGMGTKGAAMTTFVSLAGRFLVISPHSDRSGVSRKIEDRDTRQRLKETMEALAGNDDLGLILRTAGMDRPVGELKKDLEGLRKQWKGIQSRDEQLKKPGILHQEPSTIMRTLRDYFTDDIQEVWVDDAEGFKEALDYFKSTMPKYQKRLKLYVGDKSLFSAYRVEEQIEALGSSRVPLKSGGSLVIEPTEALVSVDVNSGRSNQASDIEDTALNTNLEAAEEVSRQLRLRNLGGLIVVDFIDMYEARNRKKVETAITGFLKNDKARTTIGAISQFGMLELSRQRIDTEFSHGLRIQCPNCGGTGHIPTITSAANDVLRAIRELAAEGKISEVIGELPLDVANFLLNHKREALRDLELEFEIRVNLTADPEMAGGSAISLEGVTERLPPVARKEDQREEEHSAEAAEAAEESSGRKRRRRRGRGQREDGSEYPREERSEAAPAHEVDSGAGEGAGEGAEDSAEPERAIAAADVREEEPRRPDAGQGTSGRPPRRERQVRPQKTPSAAPPKPSQDNGSGAQMEFRSEHIITDPEAVKKLPPARVRSKPFDALQASVAPNSVLFDSNTLFAPANRDASAGAAEKPAAAEGKSPGRGSGKKAGKSAAEKKGRKPSAKAAKPAAGDDSATKTAKSAKTDDSGTPAKKSAAGARKTGGRKPSAKGKKPAKTDPEQAAI